MLTFKKLKTGEPVMHLYNGMVNIVHVREAAKDFVILDNQEKIYGNRLNGDYCTMNRPKGSLFAKFFQWDVYYADLDTGRRFVSDTAYRISKCCSAMQATLDEIMGGPASFVEDKPIIED